MNTESRRNLFPRISWQRRRALWYQPFATSNSCNSPTIGPSSPIPLDFRNSPTIASTSLFRSQKTTYWTFLRARREDNSLKNSEGLSTPYESNIVLRGCSRTNECESLALSEQTTGDCWNEMTWKSRRTDNRIPFSQAMSSAPSAKQRMRHAEARNGMRKIRTIVNIETVRNKWKKLRRTRYAESEKISTSGKAISQGRVNRSTCEFDYKTVSFLKQETVGLPIGWLVKSRAPNRKSVTLVFRLQSSR